METNRRQYSEEFKKEAVEYSLASEKSVKEVARDLGISYHNLDRWRGQYRKRGELAFPGHGKERLTPQEEENRRHRHPRPYRRGALKIQASLVLYLPLLAF